MPRRRKTGAATGKPSKAMVLATQAQVLKQYISGKTKEQIGVSLSIPTERVDRYLNEAMDALVKHWAKPSPEHTFVRYAAFQMGIIEKLQRSYDRFMAAEDNNRQHSAAIAALKAQSDIMDKVMTQGHQFGVITQRKADAAISMSRSDLRTELRNEIELLASLLAKVDNHDTFTRRRQAALQKQGKPTNGTKRLLVRIRKVKRNALGYVTAVPDWKFKKQAHQEAGGIIPQHQATPEQRAQLTTETTTQLSVSISNEQDEQLFREYSKRSPTTVIETTATPAAEPEQRSQAGYDIPTNYNE